jgi:uncharacterized RDD family membrane protein YckC
MENTIFYVDEDLTASSGKRFLNYILDLVFFYIAYFALLVLFGILVKITGGVLTEKQLTVLALILYPSYYITTEAIFGRTIAKFITGTVVVNEYGEKPKFSVILKRNLCRFIPFDGSRGWHDSISGTYVVNKKDLDESVRNFHDLKQIGQEVE